MNNNALLGSCLCGSVRYEITASLENTEHRYCSMCGKAHGAAFSTNSVVTLGTVDGDPHVLPERHVFVASKGPWYEIADDLPQFKIYPGFEPTDGASSVTGG